MPGLCGFPASRAERAQLAMVLEVLASPKPGNVDRCHDYDETRLEHFIVSSLAARSPLEAAEARSAGLGSLIEQAVRATSCHSGGNTHFGAFLLLIPLVYGGGVEEARRAVEETTVEDAVAFFRAFALTRVRVNETDELDVNDPGSADLLRRRGMTLLDVMAHSSGRDMVAREWTNGFVLCSRGARMLLEDPEPRTAVRRLFLSLLADEIDTFIVKKHGPALAEETRARARAVLEGRQPVGALDDWCIAQHVNPGSLADITIGAIYLALEEGWRWDS
ncbi:MAG TPA: triphosphoribosyl-dephospho-CoA synthase [Methanoregulaceae archaeon]|nr:triphosphoribosyl-dephospho-CoA synthase [Methanoregulaceae archaeon]